MAFDPAGRALRARFEREAQAIGAGAAAGPAALLEARSALRRSVALGQPGGGAARGGALAALAGACELAFGVGPSPQQLAATLAMYEGHAVELGHVGGATLAVALCAVLEVWSGRRCHLVRASDYLAARDAAALAPLYALCGCSVATLAADTDEAEVARRYQSDIVYATGRQLVADFLRGQLQGDATASGPAAAVALVDDIDAVLVDEAGSPVLISGTGSLDVLDDATLAARGLVASLQAGRDYLVGRTPVWQVRFTDAGLAQVAALARGLPVYWQQPQRRDDLLTMAILARDVFEPGRHYQVQDGRVLIADDTVLRLLAGRPWQFGPLQAIEARENLPLSAPPRTLARTALQTFFPRYARVAGIGASLGDVRGELRRCYRLQTVSLQAAPPLQPRRSYDYPDQGAKLAAFVDLVEQCQREGVPALVGAPRTADLAAIGRLLAARTIAFVVADGRDPEADAATLAAAGDAGKLTLATGAALRSAALPSGVDRSARGLLFEHWDAARADRAFFAWCADGVVFASHEDEVLVRSLPLWAAWLRLPARRPHWAVRLMLTLSQWNGARQASRYRQSLGLREQQLDEQLAFSKIG